MIDIPHPIGGRKVGFSRRVVATCINWDHGPNLKLAKKSQKKYDFSMLGNL